MSDRPRRALADDEEPEEIFEDRPVTEGPAPARRAVDSDDARDLPPAHAARAMVQAPEPDEEAEHHWKGPVWVVPGRRRGSNLIGHLSDSVHPAFCP